jgi:hypothetical protein
MKQSLTTAGLVATTGATLALGTIGAAPSTAALLNFNFVTDNGTGSFTLNTSILDIDPTTSTTGFYSQGLFPSAITNVKYSQLGGNPSGSLDLLTLEGSNNFQPVSIWNFTFGDTPFTFQFQGGRLVNQLSDNPEDYSLLSDFGIIIFPNYFRNPNDSSPDYGGSLSVSVVDNAASVPEPSMVLGLGLLGMWSLKRILSSLQRA